MLAEDPTNIEGLVRTSQLELAPSAEAALSRYGVESLAELARQEWSRAELLMVTGIGRSSVGQLALAMRAFGFSLAPDREAPKEHALTPQAQHWAEERARRERGAAIGSVYDYAMRQLQDMAGRLDRLEAETDGPEPIGLSHPAGSNVVYFPRRRALPADDWDGGQPCPA